MSSFNHYTCPNLNWGTPKSKNVQLAENEHEKVLREIPAGKYTSIVTYGFFNYVKVSESVDVGDILVPGSGGYAAKKRDGDGKIAIGVVLAKGISEGNYFKVPVAVGKY